MSKVQTKSIPAVPFMRLVAHFAFMCGLPFAFYKDQLIAIQFYKDSLKDTA